jgi:Fe-S-cluster containining protein
MGHHDKEALVRMAAVLCVRSQVESEEMNQDVDNFMEIHCDKCGECCRTFPKFQITKRELKQIAKRLDISWQKLIKRLRTRLIGQKCYIHQPCIFLKDNLCRIYDIRPWNCRAFPLYPIIENNELLLRDLSFECNIILEARKVVEQ